MSLIKKDKLEQIINVVENNWVFNEGEYSEYGKNSNGFFFIFRHVFYHLTTIIGEIARIFERYDHSSNQTMFIFDTHTKAKNIAIKLLINSIQLLSSLDMDAVSISNEVDKYFEKKDYNR
jgi:hypothetical protein